jgi:hypothetical protein
VVGATGGVALAQATSGNQPVVHTSVIGGHRAVAFDGTSDYLDSASDITTLERPFTIYLVLRADGGLGGSEQTILQSLLGAGGEMYSNGATRHVWGGSGNGDFGDFTTSAWGVWCLTLDDAGNATSYFNGSATARTAAPAPGGLAGTLRLANHSSATKPWHGAMAEVVLCDGAHDATEPGLRPHLRAGHVRHHRRRLRGFWLGPRRRPPVRWRGPR